MQENNLYGNIAIHSAEDIFMFFTSERKLAFYKRNNLVDKVHDKKYKLNFTPKGLGWADMDEVYSIPRVNRCVVTGETNHSKLTRHHIVPRVYRQYFPFEIKRNHQFVVLIEKEKHYEYTLHEQKFYDEIARKYGTSTKKEKDIYYHDIMRVYRVARILIERGDTMHPNGVANLRLHFLQLTGQEPTPENLSKYELKSIKPKRNDFAGIDFSKEVVDKIAETGTGFDEFNLMWLNHFVDTMKPKFLPEDLKILL